MGQLRCLSRLRCRKLDQKRERPSRIEGGGSPTVPQVWPHDHRTEAVCFGLPVSPLHPYPQQSLSSWVALGAPGEFAFCVWSVSTWSDSHVVPEGVRVPCVCPACFLPPFTHWWTRGLFPSPALVNNASVSVSVRMLLYQALLAFPLDRCPYWVF